MEVSIKDVSFQMQVVVPVAPFDFHRLHQEARLKKISVAELIRQKLGIFSMATRKQFIQHQTQMNNGK